MKGAVLGILIVLVCGCENRYERAARMPANEAKDRLLKLHSDWLPFGQAFDGSFRLRGYLIHRDLADEISGLQPRGEQLAALEGTPEEIAGRGDALGSEDRWKGIVYVRMVGDPAKEKLGVYNDGRVVIRAGCLFFGDKEMLKQIDKDLR